MPWRDAVEFPDMTRRCLSVTHWGKPSRYWRIKAVAQGFTPVCQVLVLLCMFCLVQICTPWQPEKTLHMVESGLFPELKYLTFACISTTSKCIQISKSIQSANYVAAEQHQINPNWTVEDLGGGNPSRGLFPIFSFGESVPPVLG